MSLNILSIYEKIRDENSRIEESRKREVYEKIPKIFERDMRIAKIGVEAAKSSLVDENSTATALENIAELKLEKEKLLVEEGFPNDYLESIYSCPICKDTGYVEDTKKCSCMVGLTSEKLYSISNMDYQLSRENFANFNEKLFSATPLEGGISPRENILFIKKLSQNFIDNFHKENDENLLFYGQTGLGKTFMINCIAKELMDRNTSVVYYTAFALMDLFRSIKFDREKDELKELQFNMVYNAELLIIDDLGSEDQNNFTIPQIFNIINERLITGKKTIISTNLTPEELDRVYTERVFSRLTSKFKIVEFIGEDLRYA